MLHFWVYCGRSIAGFIVSGGLTLADATVLQSLVFVIFAILFLLMPWNKLHILWVGVLIRGDINHSGEPILDISDLIYLVSFMFQFGPEPHCMEAANINGADGEVPDIADLIYLVTYMFQDGPPPASCD